EGRIAVAMTPGAAGDRRELPPERAVGEYARAVQVVGEDLLDEPRGGRLVLDAEPGRQEGVVGRLDDDRALARRVLVGVHVPDAADALAEAVVETRQVHLRAEPHETVAAQVDVRLEVLLPALADQAV